MRLRAEGNVVVGEVGDADARIVGLADPEPAGEPAAPGRLRWRDGRGGFRPAADARLPGLGWELRVARSGRMAAGAGGGGPAQAAGEADAANKRATHRAAEAAGDAHTKPLGGLGGEAGEVQRGWHWAGIMQEPGRLSRHIILLPDIFLRGTPRLLAGPIGRGDRPWNPQRAGGVPLARVALPSA